MPAMRSGSLQAYFHGPPGEGKEPPPERRAARRQVSGILCMALSTLILSVMHALVRHVGQDMNTLEVAFFRNLFGLLFLLPLILRSGRQVMKTSRPGTHLLRGIIGAVSMTLWFTGLAFVPIADATALSFTGIVFASLCAVIFLGEVIRLRRSIAIAVSFLGALIMLRPGFQEIDIYVWMVLISSACWGLAMIVVKSLSTTESPLCIVSWNAVLMTALTFLPALWVWSTPTWEQLFFLFLIGCLGSAGHLAMTRALQLADATLVLPLDFLRLIWAGAIGYFAFAEFPDTWSLIGGAIIVGSAAYISRRERLKAKES